MTAESEAVDCCKKKLSTLDRKQLKEIVLDIIIGNSTRGELQDMIESNFIDEDWKWFAEAYDVTWE